MMHKASLNSVKRHSLHFEVIKDPFKELSLVYNFKCPKNKLYPYDCSAITKTTHSGLLQVLAANMKGNWPTLLCD